MASSPALLSDAPALTRSAPRRWPSLPADRTAVLTTGDLVTTIGTVLLLAIVVPSVPLQARSPVLWIPALVLVSVGIVHALDTYDSLLRARLRHLLRRITLAALLGLAVFSGLAYFWWPVAAERSAMVRDTVVLIGALTLWRLLASVLLRQARFRTRAVVLTQGRLNRGFRAVLRHCSWAGYELAGVVECKGAAAGSSTQIDHIMHCIERERARVVILDPPGSRDSSITAALQHLTERGVTAVSLPELYESMSGRALLSRRWSPLRAARTSRWDAYACLQRGLDVLAATLGLALGAPLLLLAALAIIVDSPGQPLYCQVRVGRAGRPFRMLKLRTMRWDAEADRQPVWASRADPRVTRVGKLLRACHLDETPQLWNVLRGEMSLVGPRPERPEFVELLAARMPLYNARHAVRPGLTGWAQVQFKYPASVRETSTKLQYDLFYISHRGPVLDLVILLKTVLVVLRLEGT